jgi:fructokinase
MSTYVVGIGELVWDRHHSGRSPGGAPANFAFHASQLGFDARVVSAVGNDTDGDDLLSWMTDAELCQTGVQRNSHATGSVSVQSDDLLHPVYRIKANVAWDHLAWTSELARIANESVCVCVGTLAQRSIVSRRTIQQFLAAVPEACLRVFDVNVRGPSIDGEIIRSTLAMTDVLKLNHHEWPMIAELLNLQADVFTGAKQLLGRSPLKIVAITNGGRGSVLIDRTGSHELAGKNVIVADTVGAGDSFAAALAVNLLNGVSLEQAHIHAAEVSAYVCTQKGATPILPHSLRDARGSAVPPIALTA